MGLLKRALTRRNLAVFVVGALLAGAPLVIFDFWVGGLIDRHGEETVATVARRSAGLADARIVQVIEALDALVARGATDCRADHVLAMRQAAFVTMPIKEVSIIAPTGQVQCTHLGLPFGRRSVLSIEPLSGTNGYSLDILTLDTGERMVRLRRRVDTEGNHIAALLPTSLLLPAVANDSSAFNGFSQITTAGGVFLGDVGQRPPVDSDLFSANVRSDKFGLSVDVMMPHVHTIADHLDLRWLSFYLAAIAVLTLGIFSYFQPRRRDGDPVFDLERALAAGEFVPYYQPIVDIRSGQLRGAEVLVRWRKPDGTLVFPGSFIPLAESSGLIRPMTRDLMRRVCAEAGAALGLRPALKISFNFAGKLFSDESIVKDVRKIFSNSPIKLSQVVLELTERDPIENFTETRQIIAALQGLGVRIAIDDVGTGHSGLSYMLKLGVDIIKIDKMFVDAIGTDRNSTTIVETLVDLAHNMRMDVVAEGVENFEQVMHLRELGIRSAQGYVFAPPLPGSAFLQLIEAIDPLEKPDSAILPKEAA